MLTMSVSHVDKPKKFDETNFKHWQQKMHFYLTTLHMDRFLKEEVSLLTAESNALTVYAWKHSDYICRNYVLNGWLTRCITCIARSQLLRPYVSHLTISIKPRTLGLISELLAAFFIIRWWILRLWSLKCENCR